MSESFQTSPSFILLALLTGLLYFANGLRARRRVQNLTQATKADILSITLGLIACGGHGFLLKTSLFQGDAVSLGLLPMLSVTAFAMSLVIALNQIRRPMNHIAQLVFPLAGLILLIQTVYTGHGPVRVDVAPALTLHIVLSILAYSLLALGALQALYLTWHDQRMKKKHSGAALFLPIQTLDTLLFESIWIGLIALTLAIGTGFLFMDSRAVPGLIHHTILTAMAWLVFVVLLWGRYRLGWRGSLAAAWTLLGFLLLALGYFGSKFVVEVVLS
ncbi:MAG: cytochrome c biogenesis protein CcsA [Pseudomonadales bacterium]|nr:cytochrome c biogenesis protein CcsA [Pseudomonadales bacterium]